MVLRGSVHIWGLEMTGIPISASSAESRVGIVLNESKIFITKSDTLVCAAEVEEHIPPAIIVTNTKITVVLMRDAIGSFVSDPRGISSNGLRVFPLVTKDSTSDSLLLGKIDCRSCDLDTPTPSDIMV